MDAARARHALTPAQSFKDYRQNKYRELESLVATRKTIYLDMNFWIAMRNPDEFQNSIKARRLLDLLRIGVKERRLLCPVSYAVDSELIKQNPLKKRLAQAKIMDELSEGIGIRNPYDIAELEFFRFFAQRSISFRRVPIDPIWTRVGHMITAIPSQRISAALYAALRLDDDYKFKENDLDDIQHSAVAAAYCDVFLTERFIANKLCLPAVRKVIHSECKVFCDFDEALSALS